MTKSYAILEPLPKGSKKRETPSEQYVRLRTVQTIAERLIAKGNELPELQDLLGMANLLLDEFVIPWMTSEEIATAERQVADAVAAVAGKHEFSRIYDTVYTECFACKVIWKDLMKSDQNRLIFGFNPNALYR